MNNKCQHLTETKDNELLKLFKKVEELFDGTVITRKTDPVDFKIK